MQITFIMGIPGAGKSTYIKNTYDDENFIKLDLLDYQQLLWEDWEMPTVELVFESYTNLLEGIENSIKYGKDIIVEHTLLKAIRRKIYLDALKKYDVKLKIICIKVKKEDYIFKTRYDDYMDVLEEPTLEEGWDEVGIIER